LKFTILGNAVKYIIIASVSRNATRFVPCKGGDTFNTLYEQYCKDCTKFGQAVKYLLGCESVSLRREGKKLWGYGNFSVCSDNIQQLNYSYVQFTANCQMIPTGDLKDGMGFLVTHSDGGEGGGGGANWEVSLLGKKLSSSDIGVGKNCSLETLGFALGKTNICRGYPCLTGAIRFSKINSEEESDMRTVAPCCQLVIPPVGDTARGEGVLCMQKPQEKQEARAQRHQHPVLPSSHALTSPTSPPPPPPILVVSY
jgi:hypothetical protein